MHPILMMIAPVALKVFLVIFAIRFVLAKLGISGGGGLGGYGSYHGGGSSYNGNGGSWDSGSRDDYWRGTEVWEREEHKRDLPREYGDERY